MSYNHELPACKVQGQRSVGTEDRVQQTDRRTEAIALLPMLMRSVIILKQHNVLCSPEWLHTGHVLGTSVGLGGRYLECCALRVLRSV